MATVILTKQAQVMNEKIKIKNKNLHMLEI
jgi:hypothetical protein